LLVGVSARLALEFRVVHRRAAADSPTVEGHGWVNWSGLATLVTDVLDLVASSLNRLVARQPLWQNDADDLTRERPAL
jgi:hypothetical protein